MTPLLCPVWWTATGQEKEGKKKTQCIQNLHKSGGTDIVEAIRDHIIEHSVWVRSYRQGTGNFLY